MRNSKWIYIKKRYFMQITCCVLKITNMTAANFEVMSNEFEKLEIYKVENIHRRVINFYTY